MDNSSRNIVKFIGTITVAALLIMAARHYAMSQEVKAPAVVKEAAKAPVAPPAAPVDATPPEDEEVADSEIIEEDYEIKMGEPSVNIGQDQPDYQAPPQPADPATEQFLPDNGT